MNEDLPGFSSAPAEPWTLPYDETATTADILACFRLLLGRHPNPEEWPGHSMHAGEALQGVVASYLNSLECTRRNLLRQDHPPEITLTKLAGFGIYSDVSDAAVGRYVREDNYEREVTAVFRRLLRPGMGVIDVGANIGYFALLSASIVGSAGHVLAIEPNPRNAKLLEASRRTNGFANLLVSQTAAGRETGLLMLNTSHSNGTTSEVPEPAQAILAAELVPSVRVDTLVEPGRRIDLVKVDVEGAEYNALLGAAETLARWRPTIISEFSPDMMPGISGISGPDYLAWLIGLGYDLAVIAPDGSLGPAGIERDSVMAAYRERARDHIDIVASPSR